MLRNKTLTVIFTTWFCVALGLLGKRALVCLRARAVTSAKPGNGVEMLRDESLDSYWQSDGAQPHLVNIQFQKKVRLAELAIYADQALHQVEEAKGHTHRQGEGNNETNDAH